MDTSRGHSMWGTGPCGGVGASPPTTETKILSRQGPGGFAGLRGFVGGGLVRQLGGSVWVGRQRWADSVPGPAQAPRPIPADRVMQCFLLSSATEFLVFH